MVNGVKTILKIVGVYTLAFAGTCALGEVAYRVIEADPIGKLTNVIKDHKQRNRKYWTDGEHDYYVVKYNIEAEY